MNSFDIFMHGLYINHPSLFGLVMGLIISFFVILPAAVAFVICRNLIREYR